jgi:DNA-binding HxlR family transcriptional regulator
MLGKLYDTQVCSAARTLEIVGERWSLLIVRNAMFARMTRFTEFQRALGIAPNILTKRLADLVEAGVFEPRPGPEYTLTAKGLELQPIILALTAWGDRWAAPDGRPVSYEHADCGGGIRLTATCDRCGEQPAPARVTARVELWARQKQDSLRR